MEPPLPHVEECYPPDERELDAKADPALKRGPGQGPAEVWICGNTAAHPTGELVHNQPTKNLLLELPPITCSGCGNVNPLGYVWSIIICTVNDLELDLPISDQGDYGTCVAHAILAAMDLMRRIRGAIAGRMDIHPLDMQDIFRKFMTLFNTSFSYEENVAYKLRDLRIECIFNIAQALGVGYETPVFRPFGWAPSTRVLRMGEAFKVPAGNVQYIIRLIAGGHPLVAAVPTGRTFRYVAAGQIYDGCNLEANHAVALIGSGVAHWPGNPTVHNSAALRDWPLHPSTRKKGPRVFFRARGSYRVQAHPEYSRLAMGGDFDIWADDVKGVVWGFHLA
ncbi:unnamed protein product [Alopecurus aequalis]